ncbi:hypothetical protein [Oceanobacillus sp. CAU 1775]
MKKFIFSSTLIIVVVLILVNFDAIYLKSKENNWNDADSYISKVNAERGRNDQSLIELSDLNIYTKYAGNNIYLTQIYVRNEFEMIFLTKGFKNGFLDWEYHTLPFTTAENIIEEALDEWILY